MENLGAVVLARTRLLLEVVKFEHTVFALPFAYLGMVLAADGLPPPRALLWITVAMVAARTLAMSVNRLADRELDARNPRTKDRALPRGLVAPRTVGFLACGALAAFEFAAWQLNPFVFALSPLALVFLLGYHYTKRFTWLSHWILGFTDGIAPAGAWAAVRGSLEPPAFLLWLAVTVWIAGFDLMYACQDVEADRREGLRSVPAVFGVAVALRWARINHAATVLALAALGLLLHLGWPCWIGIALAAVLLGYENALVKPNDLSRLTFAFFNVNGYISLIVFAGILLAVLLRRA
jgi:4-hydroxybenzoate polyprenyltransferase